MTKKTKIMQNDYKINMTDTKMKEMNSMCNLSNSIFEKGTEQGIEQNKREIALGMLKSNYSKEEIIRLTHLSCTELEQLKEELLIVE